MKTLRLTKQQLGSIVDIGHMLRRSGFDMKKAIHRSEDFATGAVIFEQFEEQDQQQMGTDPQPEQQPSAQQPQEPSEQVPAEQPAEQPQSQE